MKFPQIKQWEKILDIHPKVSSVLVRHSLDVMCTNEMKN